MTIEEEMVIWNAKFPVDRWYRKKYNIPFNSPKHRECSFIDQLREYTEEKLFLKIQNQSEYEPNKGKFIAEPTFSSEKEKEAYMNARAKQEFDNFDEEL